MTGSALILQRMGGGSGTIEVINGGTAGATIYISGASSRDESHYKYDGANWAFDYTLPMSTPS
jgi:hypothetical protein